VRDRWVLLCAVVDREAGRFSVYQDGMLIDSDALMLGSFAATRAAKIGDTAGGGGVFRGLVDDVRVYNRALTAADVDALYRAQ
jgi:hypothetical protein